MCETLLTEYCSCDKIKDEVGGRCSTCRERINFDSKTSPKKGQVTDLNTDVRTVTEMNR